MSDKAVTNYAANQRMHGVWGSRLTFIFAAAGSAVGLGNIWKFPYITGENGGGAFVMVYLVCILLVGIPIMVAEVMLGRRGRQSPINSMRMITEESDIHGAWTGIGWLGVAAGLLILSYYSVIAGWALNYIAEMARGTFLGATGEDATRVFSALQSNPDKLIFWHSVFMVMTLGVVIAGVTKGLGVAVRFLMPILIVLLLVLLAFSFRQGDFERGINFLFSFKTESLTGIGILVAMGHAFFTLSLGMGAIMAYGAYMPEHAKVGSSVLAIAILDTVIALVAGMVIFPIVFANGLEPGAGPGLLFISLPVAFGNMSGGLLFGTLFFALISVAAWSSSISLIEPGVAYLVESGRFNRITANLLLGSVAWIGGLGTVFSFNIWADKTLGGQTFFDFADFLSSSIMLPLGGLLIAFVAGWLMKPEVVREELVDENKVTYSVWRVLVRYVSPVAVLIIFGFGLYNAFA
ncbi:MAG: sodium-dependent transporter [bacterium]